MALNLAELGVQLAPLVPGKAVTDTTVVVAMSGGVDSSVTAALCHAAGYRTIGITLQLFDYSGTEAGEKKFGTCCALDDVYDARRVCQTLGIPHYVLNMESFFKEAVIDDFVQTYLAGATPIPCVRCNQRIKFKELLEKAKSLGADVLVTGHYVIKEWVSWLADGRIGGGPVLRRAEDGAKDQTYYLFATTPEQLEFIDFPLGKLTKPQVRKLAAALGLHVAEKRESQDICFVPGGDYRAVVRRYAPEAAAFPGAFVTLDGAEVGKHGGVMDFTIGQRRGVPGGFPEPMYVVELRPETHEVVIGPRAALGKKAFFVRELSWTIRGMSKAVQDGLACVVKVRAQHAGTPGVVHLLPGGRAEVILATPEEAVAPGQAAVFYTPEGVMLGGGWIEVTPLPAASGVRVEIR